MLNTPESPECEKLHQVAPFSQRIGEFLDWVHDTHGAYLAVPHTHNEHCSDADGYLVCGMRREELVTFRLAASSGIQKLLAEFFEIDLDKVEEERRALLAAIRDARSAASVDVIKNCQRELGGNTK